jgi:CDP-diacylglycerol--glycerol-3-phosphate 3-phosphatidyltransferase
LTQANQITLGRIALIPLIIILLLARVNGIAVALFLLLSFSDAVDGYVARRLNQVSDLGKFLDPLADKLLIISVLIVLVSLGRAEVIAVLILVSREFLVQGLRINAARTNNMIAASPIAKWKTGTQVAAVAMLIIGLPLSNLVLWLSVLLGLMSGGAYLWQSQIIKELS